MDALADSRRRRLAILIGLAAALPYLPLLGAGFLTYDDPYFITGQPLWTEPSLAALLDPFTRPVYGAYHPLHQASYLLDRVLFGPHAWGVRLTQTVLHALCAVSVLTLARRLALPPAGAALAALAFAWHPAHAENVAWLSQRKDLLSTLFLLLAWIIWLGPRPRAPEVGAPAPPSWPRSAAASGAFLLAVTSKSVAAVLLPCLLLQALGRGTLRRELPRLGLFGLPALLAVAAHYAAQRSLGATVSAPPLLEHLRRMGRALAYYVQNGLVPLHLSPRHPMPSPGWGQAELLAGLTLAALAVGALWPWRGRRRVLLYLGWFLLALSPTVGLVPLPAFVQERYLFLASVPLTLALGEGFAALGRRTPARRPALVGAACLLLLAACLGTARFARAWSDDLTLWRWAARVHPEDPDPLERQAARLLAAWHVDPRGRSELLPRIEELCREALARDGRLLTARLILAELAQLQGRPDEARRQLEAATGAANNSAYQAALGLALLELGQDRPEAARSAVERARHLAPRGSAELAATEGTVDLLAGDLDGAAARYTDAVGGLREWREAWAQLAGIQRLRRRSPETQEALARAGSSGAGVRAQLALDTGDAAGAARALLGASDSPEVLLARVRLTLATRGAAAGAAEYQVYLRQLGQGYRHRAALEPDLLPLLQAPR